MLDPDISTADALRHLSQPVADDPLSLDRRRFLQLVGAGVGAGLITGPGASMLDLALPGLDPAAWALGPVGPTDGILVVIGLYGGNDGLNTVVRTNDGLYRDQHGSLAVPAASTLRLDANSGLHPNLPALKRFWDDDQLAIVEGVGHTDPDEFSHFNSMAMWMSGRPTGVPNSGWIGRWLDGYLAAGKDLFAAAEVGHSLPLHMIGNRSVATTVPTNRPGFGVPRTWRTDADRRLFATVRSTAGAQDAASWIGRVGQAQVDQLDVADALSPVIPDDDQLPDTDIVAKLEVAARLINANLGFRVLTAGYGDFDSHAGQPSQHPVRLTELNEAVERFFSTLDPAWTSRVTVMTFSEFGRTSYANDGQGTDHGSSAPQLVFGANVKGGFYGQRPSLAGLRRWERMPTHVDMRSYYASLIDGWLGGGSSDVLGGNFENLRLFSRGPGIEPGGGVAPGPAVTTAASGFVPLTPKRIADTRDGTGGVVRRRLRQGESSRVKVRGVAGVPSHATAVVANVTAVEPSSAMYFTVFPGSTARPLASNLNSIPGPRPVPNLVVMGIGADDGIEVFNSHGETHCIVDVFGYFTTQASDRFVPTGPERLFDTRSGDGARRGKLGHREALDIQVAGRAGVPSSGASAVVMNVTVTEPDAPGFVSVAPAGGSTPDTSNLNYLGGDTVPNLTICKLGSGGKVTLDGVGGDRHVLADVFGYFTSNGDQMRSTPPRRLLDTREGLGAPQRKIGPSHSVTLKVGGSGAVPTNATAVVLNVTATEVTGPSYVTVWPHGEEDPGTSNLNLVDGQTVANLVICRLGEDGSLTLGNKLAECAIIADVLGYFL